MPVRLHSVYTNQGEHWARPLYRATIISNHTLEPQFQGHFVRKLANRPNRGDRDRRISPTRAHKWFSTEKLTPAWGKASIDVDYRYILCISLFKLGDQDFRVCFLVRLKHPYSIRLFRSPQRRLHCPVDRQMHVSTPRKLVGLMRAGFVLLRTS